MGTAQQPATADRYTIRPFDAGDFDSFRSLYESVWGWRYDKHVRLHPDREWFAWKYGDSNPFYDETPVTVATTDGELVGAKPHIPIRLRADTETPLALIGTDTMVHEAHRGRGLFSRMIDHTLARYAEREPALTFNFPNEKSRPGYRKQGWYILGTRAPTAYRIQDPAPFVRRYGGAAGTIGAPIARAGTQSVTRALDRIRPGAAGVTVETQPSNPAQLLGSLPGSSGEPTLHVNRDSTYYRWLLDEPLSAAATSDTVVSVDRTVYAGYRGGTPMAGAVVDTAVLGETESYRRLTDIVDVVPFGQEERSDAVLAVLGQVLDDARTSQVVRVAANALSPQVRRRLGFLSETNPLLSRVVSPGGPLGLRPLGDQFSLGGLAVTDPDNWQLTNAEQW